MNISIGRIVHYILTAEDAEKINRRRTTGGSIADRLQMKVSAFGPGSAVAGEEAPIVHAWPEGAQAHIGIMVAGGMEFPAMCVRDWSANRSENEREAGVPANFQVFLDGNDVYWATSRKEDQGKTPAPGTWHWPARE